MARAIWVLTATERVLKTHESPRSNVKNMACVVYFRFLFECRFKSQYKLLPSIRNFSYLVTVLTSVPVLFASLPLAATIVAFLAVPRGFTRLAGVVYSFVLGSFHTKCVGEETISESQKVDRKKKHLRPGLNVAFYMRRIELPS